MKILAVFMSALLLASLYDEALSQCTASWSQSYYVVNENDLEVILIVSVADGTILQWSTDNNNATAGEDYLPVSGADIFNDGDTISIFIIDDNTESERNETFFVTLRDFDNNICDSTTVVIVDDEPFRVATIVWEFDVYEFDEGGIYNICAVTNDTIEGSRTERRRVEFKNGTAIADLDFDDPDVVQEVVFQEGDQRQCVQIEIFDDSLLELEECFFVCLVSDIPGIEMSTTKIFIEDDEGAVTVSPEREIYTVIEGNDLEVCLVIANNTPAVFQFHAIGYFYLRDYHILFRFYFFVGDYRSCATASIPGNTYVDKQEREQELFFAVEDSEFSEFVTFERSSSWIYVTDDDIARVGFSSPYFSVIEGEGSVSVCIQLCEGTTNRPIDFLLYTNDGTAIAGTNYEQTVGIVTLPAPAVAGDIACTEITILDDGVQTDEVTFSLSLSICDTHVIIPDDKAGAVVHILPAFEICFDMDSPRVSGNELFISFDSTIPVGSATCYVETLGEQDCTNGSTVFIFTDEERSQPYDILITVTSNRSEDEVRTLETDVRSELTGICDTHLVNKGVIIDGNNVTVNVQPTGPDSLTRIVDLECRCRPNEDAFESCPGGILSASDSVTFVYEIPDGCTRLSIRQDDGGLCSPRRALHIDF